jgi:hypothetical protein
MFVTQIESFLQNRLFPGIQVSITYGGTVYYGSWNTREGQILDEEINTFAPEVWESLLELGRNTYKEDWYAPTARRDRTQRETFDLSKWRACRVGAIACPSA